MCLVFSKTNSASVAMQFSLTERRKTIKLGVLLTYLQKESNTSYNRRFSKRLSLAETDNRWIESSSELNYNYVNELLVVAFDLTPIHKKRSSRYLNRLNLGI